METPPLHIEARASSAWPVSAQGRRELQPEEISPLLTLTKCREVTDEEIELIEMRCQQLLAVVNLEDLFAEGRLDCM